MTHKQEVQVRPEALAKGTQHRGGKCAAVGCHGSSRGMPNAGWPARGRAVEAIGAVTCRTRVKRRKACAVDEPAPRGEIRYLLLGRMRSGDARGSKFVRSLTQRDLLGCAGASGGLR